MNAFDQLLAEGYIRGELGSGTFVEAGLVNGGQSDSKSHHLGEDFSKPRLSRGALRVSGVVQMPASSPLFLSGEGCRR
jgi:DNA-binding GntR family transcriptional regulator